MPNPKKFKDEESFMKECMHQTMHIEKKKRDQAIAQCLQMWRDRNKKKMVSIASIIKDTSRLAGDSKILEEAQA